MVMFASLLGVAALYAGVVSARPMPDDNVGEVAVSAPYGTPESDVPAPTGSSNYGSSNYGSSYGNSYGGSYDNSYGGSADDSTSTWTSSASAYTAAATWSSSSSAYAAAATYGSGSSSWGGSGYDGCVQQCVANYGAPSSMAMPTQTGTSEGSYGTGATHTVWVAPTQGVLRYVPFATNASVGDTIKFIWGGNDHTVTKSSILGICNKTSDAPFASGTHNLSFVFTQVVNDTNPTFYYCGTPTHCQKGMFGIINPPNAFQGPGSASSMIPALASNYSSTATAVSACKNATQNNAGAANWGSNIDMSGMPGWSQSYAAENIMYTRTFLAANPEVLKSDGTVDMSLAQNNALMIPADVVAASNNAASAPASSSVAAPSAASTSATPSSSASTESAAKTNGAGVLSSSRVAVAAIAVLAAALAL
ncbi:hypothetical protein BV25DRAFT_1836923 [Artomyces pyxidatus]|uniref:Uncharacterized protein n=1 Tax=Artomyces pyxidatus TaxID=48021 RepID=A0ACB8T7U9_9AGAM|nr:hypothetical protein BV25DRAFT_1836923 [Artomyces pyxidatus]